MEDSEKLFPRSFKQRFQEVKYDKGPTILLVSILAFIVIVLAALTYILVSTTSKENHTNAEQTVIKVYLNDNDSIVPILHRELDTIKTKLDDMRKDSLSVQIHKIRQ